MTSEKTIPHQTKISFFSNLKKKLLAALKLTNAVVVKVYNGYGNSTHCIVFGHVLKLSPLPRKRFSSNFLTNTLALLRLFMVRPLPKARLRMKWEDASYETIAEDDGFFRFEWKPRTALKPGWHHVRIEALHLNNSEPFATGEATLFIPSPNEYAFISDIDDTFLISHSSKIRKRLYVLLTENARSRDPFEGVVNHYQLLSQAQAQLETTNPFFYVSSSEWNLYDYIREFSKEHKLPEGVYLLGQIKKFKQVFKTGQNNHATKFMRIARILEAFPEQKFILLGDDSQEDPNIYAAAVDHFKNKIFCVYLRHIHKKKKESALKKIEQIKNAGVHCCYFEHSAEAVIHSKQLGLITA